MDPRETDEPREREKASGPHSLHRRRKRLSISIRPMEIDDLAQVFHLGERLFTAEDVPNLYRTWDEHEVVDLFHSDPELCLVAEEGERIVGFAMGTTVTKSRSAWKYGHLVWLGVDPEYQGTGVAEKLFHALLELMLEDGVRILIVDTEADNYAAIKFFRKMGFSHPQEHIYLAMNLDNLRQRLGARKTLSKEMAKRHS
jgi:ribosomal protein S18 acetylase RimI-like enzyme